MVLGSLYMGQEVLHGFPGILERLKGILEIIPNPGSFKGSLKWSDDPCVVSRNP